MTNFGILPNDSQLVCFYVTHCSPLAMLLPLYYNLSREECINAWGFQYQ